VPAYLVAFRALLDNYEADTRQPEKVTAEEERENCYFLDVVMDTPVMQTAHQFLVSQGRAPVDVSEFKQRLYDIWFKLYKRLRGDRLVYRQSLCKCEFLCCCMTSSVLGTGIYVLERRRKGELPLTTGVWWWVMERMKIQMVV